MMLMNYHFRKMALIRFMRIRNARQLKKQYDSGFKQGFSEGLKVGKEEGYTQAIEDAKDLKNEIYDIIVPEQDFF